MAGMQSKNKGKNAEREVINLLQPIVEMQYQKYSTLEIPLLERNLNQSNKGGYDIIGLDFLAIEIKRQETLNLTAWWSQCVKQAKSNQIPILLYRQNNKPWCAVMEVDIGYGVLSTVQIPLADFLKWFTLKLEYQLTKLIPPPPRSE